MAEDRSMKWPGGFIRVRGEGAERVLTYVIRRRLDGDLKEITTGCHTYGAAMKELEEFETGPDAYIEKHRAQKTLPKPVAEASVFFTEDLVSRFIEYQRVKGVSEDWRYCLRLWLEWWMRRLAKVDLRHLDVDGHLFGTSERPGPLIFDPERKTVGKHEEDPGPTLARRRRFNTLRDFMRWMADTSVGPKLLKREQIATLLTLDADLDTAEAQAVKKEREERGGAAEDDEDGEKKVRAFSPDAYWYCHDRLREMAESMSKDRKTGGYRKSAFVYLFYADILIVMRGIGGHYAELRKWTKKPKFEEVDYFAKVPPKPGEKQMVFPHKIGDSHVVRVEKEVVEAAERLAGQKLPGYSWMNELLKRLSAEGGFNPPVMIGAFRHSSLTWALKMGVSKKDTMKVANHHSESTHSIYTGTAPSQEPEREEVAAPLPMPERRSA